MRRVGLLIAVILLVIGCVHKSEQIEELNLNGDDMTNWQVPDGFTYDMSPQQNIQVSFIDGSSRINASETLQYAIVGTDYRDSVYALHVGYASLAEGIKLTFSKPIHIENLFLYTKYQGNSRYFDVTNGNLTISLVDLEVSDSFFDGTGARLSSIPDCTSFLGNATQIRCRAEGISIKSSASITYIDIHYSDGSLERRTPEEQGINANDNQWFFLYSEFDVNSIEAFSVVADCRTSPHSLSTELVTFINPCSSTLIDSDNDGVADESDISPDDATIAAVTYIPAHNSYSTFAFEDMWPYLGDFDFNDLIIAHNAVVYTNAQDMVTKITYQISVEAAGATFDNDLCLSFTDPGSTINMTVNSISTGGLSYELHKLENKSEIRFKHIKQGFNSGGFINTDSTRSYEEPIQISLELLFDGAVNFEDFEIDEFIRVDQEEGREVHKPGKPYTSLFDKSWVGQAADDTRPEEGKYFLTENNLPWAIEIPTPWEYPKEKVQISKAYPYFEDYIQGKSNTPWYTDEDGNKVHKHLYKRK